MRGVMIDVLLSGKSDTADGEKKDTHGQLTPEVECAATEPAHEEPGKDSTNSTDGVLTKRHGETVLNSHASHLVEVGTGLSFLLHLVGVNHHGNRLVGLELGLGVAGGKSLQGNLGLFDAALSDEPPGRLGGEVDADDERNGPHPLQSKGDLVTPLVVAGDHGAEDTRGDKLSQNPAEVDVGCQIGAEVGRADFRGVGSGKSLEDTPGNTDKDLSNEKLNQSLGEEDDEDEADASNESTDESLAVSKAIGNDTVDEETENLTTKSTVGETRLPSSCQLISTIRLLDTKLALEGRIGKEVVEKNNVKTLHDDAE
ncbi:hypothetical protein HG531_008385 [Fusarium graminearum]|nr:hypothetical protein HG531_008385 [Fusarium graminearum]